MKAKLCICCSCCLLTMIVSFHPLLRCNNLLMDEKKTYRRIVLHSQLYSYSQTTGTRTERSIDGKKHQRSLRHCVSTLVSTIRVHIKCLNLDNMSVHFPSHASCITQLIYCSHTCMHTRSLTRHRYLMIPLVHCIHSMIIMS